MFEYDISQDLKKQISILIKKDKVRADSLYKKIKEIIACDEYSIEHYKNLKAPLNEYKRVHLSGGSFVLLFQIFKKEKKILFLKLEHHDKVYK